MCYAGIAYCCTTVANNLVPLHVSMAIYNGTMQVQGSVDQGRILLSFSFTAQCRRSHVVAASFIRRSTLGSEVSIWHL